MKRNHYLNGEKIDLTQNGCDGCSPCIINGVLCHEKGCPEAWKDSRAECRECGCEFYPIEQGQRFCDICLYPDPDL